GAGIRLGVRPDPSAVRLHDRARQVESQPGTLRLSYGICRAVKTVKDMRQVFGINPWALIANTDNDLFGTYASRDLDLSVLRILEGIGDEIHKYLLNPCFIAQ